MARTKKLLTSLSTVAFTGVVVLSACSGEGEGEGAEGADPTTLAQPQGEGEGEGAEGEGEGVTRSGDPATDNVEYMHRLGLVRGHLVAFIELYRVGEYDAAGTHVKHPESELYAGLVPAFEARGKPGFADALNGLVAASDERADVDAAYAIVGAAISANAPSHSVAEKLLAIAEMARTSGEEFDIAVEDDGSITNAHEYQDAYGFLNAAREMLSATDTNDINEADAIALAHEQLDLSLTMFEGLMAERTEGLASTIHGAAARIEIAALGLR